MSESIILLGNGITLDTYKGKFTNVEFVDDKVDFMTDIFGHVIHKEIFSEEMYPDFFNYISSRNSNDFSNFTPEILKNIFINQKQLNELQNSNSRDLNSIWSQLFDSIALFNSACDYIYKLFWLYYRQSFSIDTEKTGLNLFLKGLFDSKKRPVFINLNYDLLIERHLEKYFGPINYFGFQKKVSSDNLVFFKPHGSINFMSNQNNTNDNGFYNEYYYPITNKIIDSNQRNPLRFYCKSIHANKLGEIIEIEKPMFVVELVPPGCSSSISQKYSEENYLLPWAQEIFRGIFSALENKKNMIICGISFWDVDIWELVSYISYFIDKNKKGLVYILAFSEKDRIHVEETLKQNQISFDRIRFLGGSFSNNYHSILDVI